MPKKEECRFRVVLIIRGQIQPYLVTGLEPARIRHERDAIADFLADRYGFKGEARQHRSSGLAGEFVHLAQARA